MSTIVTVGELIKTLRDLPQDARVVMGDIIDGTEDPYIMRYKNLGYIRGGIIKPDEREDGAEKLEETEINSTTGYRQFIAHEHWNAIELMFR
jgi:hypothetical protein